MDYNPPLSRHQKSTLDLGDPTLQFTPRKKASKIITQYETYTKHIRNTYTKHMGGYESTLGVETG